MKKAAEGKPFAAFSYRVIAYQMMESAETVIAPMMMPYTINSPGRLPERARNSRFNSSRVMTKFLWIGQARIGTSCTQIVRLHCVSLKSCDTVFVSGSGPVSALRR